MVSKIDYNYSVDQIVKELLKSPIYKGLKYENEEVVHICPVCTAAIVNMDGVKHLKCKSCFHLPCLMKNAKNNNCPDCDS